MVFDKSIMIKVIVKNEVSGFQIIFHQNYFCESLFSHKIGQAMSK
jgi:hypothetical protein